MSSLLDTLVPTTKVPISVATFVSYIFPLLASLVLTAVLALKPQTRTSRIALWPVVALLAFRAAVSVDLSNGRPERRVLNVHLVRFAICWAAHSLSWALAEKPLVRHLRPAKSTPSTIKDALDLVTTLRGHGWDWSRGLHVPRDTRPTNRYAFALYAALEAVANALILGGLRRVIHTFTRDYGFALDGPSIFDETLPVFVRYTRAVIISIFAHFMSYSTIMLSYNGLTVLGVLVLGQDPAQWPPPFDNPWFATSLSDLWSRRWHHNFRHTLIVFAYPFNAVFGRVGGLIGAFLASGVIHHFMLIMLNSELDPWWMMVGFGMMAPGIIVERAYYKLTGRKVGGAIGWLWTMSWFLGWGLVIAEGFLKAGMFGQPRATSRSEGTAWVLLEDSVAGFDAWLHRI